MDNEPSTKMLKAIDKAFPPIDTSRFHRGPMTEDDLNKLGDGAQIMCVVDTVWRHGWVSFGYGFTETEQIWRLYHGDCWRIDLFRVKLWYPLPEVK